MQFHFTPAVKNIIIINLGIYVLALFLYAQFQININQYLGLHSFFSDQFQVYQIFTHMFMHSFVEPNGQIAFGHVFFNMLTLLVFGPLLESRWGSKRFVFFYLFTGLGAGLSYWAINAYEVYQLREAVSYYLQHPNPEGFAQLLKGFNHDIYRGFLQEIEYFAEHPDNPQIMDWSKTKALELYQISTWFSMVGASGCIYGILMAAALLFPNTEVMPIFIPIPIKIKYIVLFAGLSALYMQIKNAPDDNVAHFAHLAGMAFGYVLVRFWNRRRDVFY